MRSATAEQMRRIEALAVEQGSTYESLMNRAGEACSAWLLSHHELVGGSVAIVCGRGNNGGDGFVLARQLWRLMPVTVILAEGEPTALTAAAQYDRLMTICDSRDNPPAVYSWVEEPYLCSAAIREAAVVVDGVYGIGYRGDLPALLRPLFQQMNAASGYKVAVDMPSGVSADDGVADSDAFRADYTLSFTVRKRGQDNPLCGLVSVLNIGIPESVVEEVLGNPFITPEWVAERFIPRAADSHKGTYGRLLTVCGSYGMAGAALLCARAALRSGVGLVTAAVPQSVYPLLAAAVPEAVFAPMPQTAAGTFSIEAAEPLRQAVAGATAVVIGPGIGTGEDTRRLVEQMCRYSTRPVVLDADGINCVTPHILVEETVSAPLILTPHPGEMARLLGKSVEWVQQNRREIVRRCADEWGVTLVLKGHGTLVCAPGRPILENPTGNPGMATGGSGDVLAGIIGALAAQGMDPYYAAACGVYLHGMAGDGAAERLSQHGMLPSDIIEELPSLFLQFEK